MADCIFCRISAGDIPAKKVHEDADCVAFQDIQPQAPTHIVLIPRRHVASLATCLPEDEKLLGHLLVTASALGRSLGLEHDGYRVVLNTGAQAGQTVFHLHVHLLAGRHFGWPPG